MIQLILRAILRNFSIKPIPMSDSSDAHLQLKKRARRRLVGAVAFAGLAAVILPMVMDDEPKQQVQDVQIRIPGQDQAPFSSKVAKPPNGPESVENVSVSEQGEQLEPPPATVVAKPVEVPLNKPEEVKVEKAERVAEHVAEKAQVKVLEKVPAKNTEKQVAKSDVAEPQRAAAILSGKAAGAVPVAPSTSNGNGQFVVLIGAFSNPANVKQLQAKIGELGVKVFTESLDSPSGKKTRVRAGPFPSREAASKALDKMKRIGVNGVVAAKQ